MFLKQTVCCTKTLILNIGVLPTRPILIQFQNWSCIPPRASQGMFGSSHSYSILTVRSCCHRHAWFPAVVICSIVLLFNYQVKCENKVYHPNIDLDGNVCLNILREDWKPVLTINSIVYGLQYLFLEPNPEDPLNKVAAQELQSNRRSFENNVQKTMKGGHLNGVYFERCLKQ